MGKKIEAPFSVRQGDVLLVAASYRGAIPDTAIPIEPEQDRVVLAHGEVTGHAHVAVPQPGVTERPVLLDANAERFLHVAQEAAMRHEEHGAIVLREGRYQQAFQVEEQGDEVRPVTD